MLRVGLAMLQGARHEHAEALRGAAKELGFEVDVVPCRTALEVSDDWDALVLPGGESTTMRIASQHESLLNGLYAWMERHPMRPVLGTCAGAILLANPGGEHTPFVRVDVARNAWGRQRDSFEAAINVDLLTPDGEDVEVDAPVADAFSHQPLEVMSQGAALLAGAFPGVFIRAPRFDSDTVRCEVVARLGNEIVGVKDGARMGLTFHPELTLDRRFHRWLLHEAIQAKEAVP